MDKVKRIAALIGVILIASMYIISFITAIFASSKAPGFFLASIFSTIVIPIMIYIYITIYKYVHKDDNPDLPEDNSKDSKS